MARERKRGAQTGTAGSRRIAGAGSAPGRSTPASGGTRTGSSPGRAARTKASARAERRAARRQRLASIRTAFTMTRAADPRLVPLLAIAFLVPFVLLLLVGFAIGHPLLLGFFGLLAALICVTVLFGRRVQRQAYSSVEGQVGAGAAVLNSMRGDWRVSPAVGVTREQDLVHRVVGRPGVVLVGEGAPNRARTLVVNEKKKLARFIGDTPVYDVLIGDGEGQVPLRGLEKHFGKLPRNITPKEVNSLDRRLKAMGAALPVPKGPMPTTGRIPRGKMR